MKTFALALFLLSVAVGALATPSLSPEQLTVSVGGTVVASFSEVTWGTTSGRVRIGTEDESIARVTDGANFVFCCHGGHTAVTFAGVRPGTVNVLANGTKVGTITVTCAAQPLTLESTQVSGRANVPLQLALAGPVASTTILTWYLGHTGDMSHPLAASGSTIDFTPVAGTQYVWVASVGPCATATAEVRIDAVAPRSRSVRH